MSDETREPIGPSLPPAIQQSSALAQNLRIDLNTSGLSTAYTNFFRVTGTFEELILDFGLHTGALLPNGPEPVKLNQRTVMSFHTAKRLLSALQHALSRHEQAFGSVEIDPTKRPKHGG